MKTSPTSINSSRRLRYTIAFIILAVFVLVMLVVNICLGSVKIPFGDLIKVLMGSSQDFTASQIVWEIRMPRAFAALILGGALALSGYLLQTFFHNPIAGPFVLGISNGAKLTVALVMVYFVGRAMHISSLVMILAAFAGAMISMGFVLLISRRVSGMAMLIVAGVMIGYICNAITDFVVTFADDSNIVNLHNWSLGSFSGITWNNVAVMSVVCLASFVVIFFMAKPIGAYQLGQTYAVDMGVNIRRLRVMLVIFSSILAACVTAFAGPISFVGMAVPHLVKFLFKTNKPLVMIPACYLGGAAFCLVCDLLARLIFAPTELSISTVTAIFGAPVVIVVMVRRQKNRDEQ